MFKKIQDSLLNFFNFEKTNYNFSFPLNNDNEETLPYKENEPKQIFSSIDKNLEYLKFKYNYLINTDIVIRNFSLHALNEEHKSFMIFIDGLTDSEIINDFALRPLMKKKSLTENTSVQNKDTSNKGATNNNNDLSNYIYNCLLPQCSINISNKFDEVISSINKGHCLIFVDGIANCFDLDVKDYKQRSISQPNNEVVIRGPQAAFNEVLRTNTSLIRRIINNEHLIIESINVGKLSKTPCAICYMDNIANSDLVAEVKNRMNNIDLDYLISSGQLEQMIEDNNKLGLPQMMASERPDKVSHYLLEGRVAVIVNGSPYALIMPGILVDFLTSPEDFNLNFIFSNILKFVRLVSFIITLLLPGLYIAITTYHQELLPTEFLFTIVSSRSSVPFPIIFEVILMELSFELIREATLRIPSSMGPTIGIIGALILGQASVEASIISPVLIIVVAITGICSFAIPDFSLSFHCRFVRFIYIILGYISGFLGIAIGLFLHLSIFFNLKSFGVPYLQPYLTFNSKNSKGFFLPIIWKREKRPPSLNTKRKFKQPYISQKWKKNNIEKRF